MISQILDMFKIMSVLQRKLCVLLSHLAREKSVQFHGEQWCILMSGVNEIGLNHIQTESGACKCPIVKGDIDFDFVIIFSRSQHQCKLYLITDQKPSVTIQTHLIPFLHPRQTFFFFLSGSTHMLGLAESVMDRYYSLSHDWSPEFIASPARLNYKTMNFHGREPDTMSV